MNNRISYKIHPISPEEHVAYDVVNILRKAGFLSFIVGGAVRDRLLEQSVNDIDVTTDATPDDIIKLFDKTIGVGKAFGVMIVVLDGHHIEVATFREDLDYRDGRHPETVVFADPQRDAERRDFTINALFYDIDRGEIVDLIGGIAGSFPIWGKYIHYCYPNWAAKFFADSLMLELEIVNAK